jgi:hypothetical protein
VKSHLTHEVGNLRQEKPLTNCEAALGRHIRRNKKRGLLARAFPVRRFD